MKSWYVIHSKPREERRALVNLANQGYTCYLPEWAIAKVHRGRRRLHQEPLFPRYLFIELDDALDAQSWAPIRSTKGVAGLVGFGSGPARVDAALIAGLRAQEVRLQEQDNGLRCGEAVIILDGPFRELQAVYEQDDGDCRAFVLIEFLNRITRIRVDQKSLIKAGKHSMQLAEHCKLEQRRTG